MSTLPLERDTVLRKAVELGASDLILTAGHPVMMTVARALRKRWEAHARIASLTLPIWLYVSITGVVVYWMLYRMPTTTLGSG